MVGEPGGVGNGRAARHRADPAAPPPRRHADEFYNSTFGGEGQGLTRSRATTAGWLLTALGNLLITFLVRAGRLPPLAAACALCPPLAGGAFDPGPCVVWPLGLWPVPLASPCAGAAPKQHQPLASAALAQHSPAARPATPRPPPCRARHHPQVGMEDDCAECEKRKAKRTQREVVVVTKNDVEAGTSRA
jgi:hypothetical protein